MWDHSFLGVGETNPATDGDEFKTVLPFPLPSLSFFSCDADVEVVSSPRDHLRGMAPARKISGPTQGIGVRNKQ
jgi:hypothetical protein